MAISFLSSALAQVPGAVDPTFVPGSRIDAEVRAVHPGPGGTAYVGGRFTTVRGAARNHIARLLADGAVDSGFDPGTGANNWVESVVLQADGKVIIGGWFSSYNGTARQRIARLNPDGTLDPTFNPGSGANGVVTSLALQSDGKIVMGGLFTTYNGVARPYLARLHADGSLDTGFDPGAGPSSGVLVVGIDDGDKIVIGGHFETYAGTTTSHLARVLPSGALDPDFLTGSRPDGIVSCLQVGTDGSILAGGAFTHYGAVGRNRIARVLEDGTLDLAFDPGSGANAAVNSIAVQADGKVLLGGAFTGVGGTARSFVARLEAAGGLDASFHPGAGAQNQVWSVFALADGRSLIGGQFVRFNGVPASSVVRLEESGALDGTFVAGSGRNGPVSAVALQPDGKALIAGEFTAVDGSSRNRIARVNADGTLDPTFDPGTGADGPIRCLLLLDDGSVMFGGEFTSYAGVPRAGIARVGANGSLDPGFDPGGGVLGSVLAMARQSDGKILIAGEFTSYNGAARNGIARIHPAGGLDESFDPGAGANAPVSAVVVQPDDKILIAGDFTLFDNMSSGRVIRLGSNGSVDSTFDQVSLADGFVHSLALQKDGRILIGGEFDSYDGVSRKGIARLESDGGLDPGFDPGAGINGPVWSMALQTDGKVVVGGAFSSVGGLSRLNLARLDAAGTTDASFSGGGAGNGLISAVAMENDGRVWVGGDFSVFRGVAGTSLMRVQNGPATTSFVTASRTRVEWLRGGTAAEIDEVSLEVSTNGVDWSPLGSPTRIAGGWALEGLNLPKAGFLRALGRAVGGQRNGSSGIIGQVAPYILPPRISIEQPAGAALVNGVSSVDFGTFAFQAGSNRTFTIRNTGDGDLSGLAIELSGPDAGAFSLTGSPAALVLPGESTTFTLRLDPADAGPRNAVLQVSSNDSERSPFEIDLTGTMEKGSQTISFDPIANQPATATLELSAGGGGSGNAVTFSVMGPANLVGNSLSFTGPGTVDVTANQAGNANYDAALPVTRSFSVTAVPATVIPGNLTHTYDGSPKNATATTVPAGLPVSFDYGGPAPVNAGSYPVTVTVTDPRYIGSASATLLIAKAAQSIDFPAIGDRMAPEVVTLAATGGGSGNPVVFSVTGAATIGGGNLLSFTGPGGVTVKANQGSGPNHEAAPEVSQTFQVTVGSLEIVISRLHQVADGSPRAIVATTDPAEVPVAITYNGSTDAPVETGSYEVEVTSADPRFEGTATGTLVVHDPSRMVRIPGGTLPAQSALGALVVPEFEAGAYEISWSLWSTVKSWAESSAGYSFESGPVGASGDLPVTGVSWYEAAKWCNAMTEWENLRRGHSLAPAYRRGGAVFKTGVPADPGELTCHFGAGGYRLPTAAEWEFAARGGSGAVPSTYAGGDTLEDLAWYSENSGGQPRPVGGKQPNGLDLYDFSGNAAEWVWDAPPGLPSQRLMRGGSWSSTATSCELGVLTGLPPATVSTTSGLRVVRSLALALTEALDDPNLNWEASETFLWRAETETTHDGVDAALGRLHLPGQSSWVETEVEGPGDLIFQWRTLGSEGQDLLTISVNETDLESLSGDSGWSQEVVELGAGSHRIRWTFSRASSGGEIFAWLDSVSFAPVASPSVTTAPANSVTGNGAIVGGNVTEDGNREVTLRGVVYDTEPNPVLETGVDAPDAVGGEGTFSLTLEGLEEGTTYFARAYAINSLGTSYGETVAFTTRTSVTFTAGQASYDRVMFPGGSHSFDFVLTTPRVIVLAASGGAALRAVLRTAAGAERKRFEGDGDFQITEALPAGAYALEVYRTGSSGLEQAYQLSFDATVTAASRPDVAVGGTPSRMVGRRVYGGNRQQTVLTSRKAKPLRFHAEFANRGNLPDAIQGRATAGNSFYKVVYLSLGRNVTASLLRGSFRTASITSGNSGVFIQVAVTPNKRKLLRKSGGRTIVSRKTLTVRFTGTSSATSSIRDAASATIRTR